MARYLPVAPAQSTINVGYIDRPPAAALYVLPLFPLSIRAAMSDVPMLSAGTPPDAPADGDEEAYLLERVETPSGVLTRRQDAFVDALVANGGKRREAAIAAGYGETSSKSVAWRLMQKPHVAAEIYRRTRLRLALFAPQALAQLEKLATEGRSEHVRREAASDLLDRLGLTAPQRVEHLTAGELRVTIDLSGD